VAGIGELEQAAECAAYTTTWATVLAYSPLTGSGADRLAYVAARTDVGAHVELQGDAIEVTHGVIQVASSRGGPT